DLVRRLTGHSRFLAYANPQAGLTPLPSIAKGGTQMKLARMALALAALMLVGGLAYVAQQTPASGPDQLTAAQKFLDSLSAEQKARAVTPSDSPERTQWHFVPLEKDGKPTRKGLPLEEMTPQQKQAALALVRAGTSEQGDHAAVTIMSLEAILKVDEEKKMGPTR